MPLSPVWLPCSPNVILLSPRPRPPWPPSHKNISQWPDPTAPNVGGSPQSQTFCHPSFSSQAKLSTRSETLRMGFSLFAFINCPITVLSAFSYFPVANNNL